MITVKQATYVGDYRIRLLFSTGEEGIADLKEVITRYAAARPLLDPKQFSLFQLDDWPTLAWSCGFDLSPETLYELATGNKPVWLQETKIAA